MGRANRKQGGQSLPSGKVDSCQPCSQFQVLSGLPKWTWNDSWKKK
ncbi:mCG5163 [Mus musculus]|nr:mCG5163 [Mus musculus]